MFNPADYEDVRVTIAGLGNIGSHTALALARMGLKRFSLYDFDTVEAHNLSSQSYTIEDVGSRKTDAIAYHMIQVQSDVWVERKYERYKGEECGGILISAVDSLEARRAICEGLSEAHDSDSTFVIDGRMGGGQIEVHSQWSSEWGATIPQEADDDACGARFISYTSYIIAGLIANNVKRHLRHEPVKGRILLHADTLQLITV